MIPGLGGHYRRYRLLATIDRLKRYPPGSTITIAKAAHLVGVTDATLRVLIGRYAPNSSGDGPKITVAILLAVLRQAYAARGGQY